MKSGGQYHWNLHTAAFGIGKGVFYILYQYLQMTKRALVAVISNHLNVSKNISKQLVDSFLDVITSSLSEGIEVRIQGFGTFKVSKRAAR